MTTKFEPSNRVTWFSGEQFEEGADIVGRIRALTVIEKALQACPNRDMRKNELLLAALDHAKEKIDKPVLATRFLKALDIQDPQARYIEARKYYEGIATALRCNYGRGIKY